MHEMSVAESIIDVVSDNVPSERMAAVTAVRVRVGSLSGVVADSLAFCFEALVADTPLGRARLDVEWVPTECVCGDCSHTFEPAGMIFLCPSCGSGRTRLVTGADLQVVHVELDEAARPSPAEAQSS
jgi:hydrogenase nickel incorporation protein HypA/HybF